MPPDENCDSGIRPECEALLSAIHTDVKMLKRAVIEGNGERGLMQTVSGHSMALKIIGVAVTLIVPILLGLILHQIWT